MNTTEIEMIACPICGKPFPKKRKELGYNYCVNCSTEKPVACIVEGSMDGDGDDTVHSTVRIISRDEATALEIAYAGRLECMNEIDPDCESSLDMGTTEEIAERELNNETDDSIDESTEEN